VAHELSGVRSESWNKTREEERAEVGIGSIYSRRAKQGFREASKQGIGNYTRFMIFVYL
jgi:hypothetical protein